VPSTGSLCAHRSWAATDARRRRCSGVSELPADMGTPAEPKPLLRFSGWRWSAAPCSSRGRSPSGLVAALLRASSKAVLWLSPFIAHGYDVLENRWGNLIRIKFQRRSSGDSRRCDSMARSAAVDAAYRWSI
jgi:hypothetical protein